MTIRNRVLRFAIAPAALLALAATVPASAQYYRWDASPPPPPSYGGRIHPQHIEEVVRAMGFQPVAEPRPRGPLWVTHAVDRDGQEVRVLIDSYSGRVIDVLRRPVPPRSVSLTPPANVPYPPEARVPHAYPPQARVPQSDYEDDDNNGPDYDYRDGPRHQPPAYPQSPQYQPQPRPNVQQQGPTVIPFEPRSDNNRVPNAPKTNTAKKKETKDKKNDSTAALNPSKPKTPSPKARPADAPKSAQTPKMPAVDNLRAPDPQMTGTVPPPDASRNQQAPSAVPPVQPPF